MKVVILCGGLGTRLREETEFRPKPMVEIGGRPILWHVMKIYSTYGFREFVLCLGYKGGMIKDYFLNYEAMNNDFSIHLGSSSRIKYHGEHLEQGFQVTLADTGLEAMTGGRIARIQKYVGDEDFLLTYGDGLSSVNVKDLVEFHHAHERIATVTVVQPSSRFGMVELLGDEVRKFVEKPRGEGWMSSGFFVLSPRIFDYLSGDDCVFEKDPLEQLALDDELRAFRHDGFFQAMDTFRDFQLLNDLWEKGKAPWKIW